MEKKLGRMRKGVMPSVIYSKYKGYCSRCHYTIWVNEKIGYDGKAYHLDCKKAILDNTPRILDKRYIKVIGDVDKKKVKAALKG